MIRVALIDAGWLGCSSSGCGVKTLPTIHSRVFSGLGTVHDWSRVTRSLEQPRHSSTLEALLISQLLLPAVLMWFDSLRCLSRLPGPQG